jgi:hypothetical protein
MVIAIVLSLGAIYAFIPIVIILILIGAAVGLTRGTDIFAALGIGALIGIGATTGKGGTGKGIAGPKVPKSTVDKIKAQGSKAGGAIKSSPMLKKGLKGVGGRIGRVATRLSATRNVRLAVIRGLGGEAAAAGGLSGKGSGGPGGPGSANGGWALGAALPIGAGKAAAGAVNAGEVRLSTGKARLVRRAAEKEAIIAARNGFTVKPGDPRLSFRGMQVLPTKGIIRSERQHALSSGGTRPSFQFQFPGAYHANIIGKFIGERIGSLLSASSIAGSKPLVEGGIRSRALKLKEARMERQDARADARAGARVIRDFRENLHVSPNDKVAAFGERQKGIDAFYAVMAAHNVNDRVDKEVKDYYSYKTNVQNAGGKPLSYTSWAKADRPEVQPPPPPSTTSQNKSDSESLRGRLQSTELHELRVKMENLTSQKRLEEIDTEKGKISDEIEKLHAEGTPEALAMVAKLSDRTANLSDRAAELSRRAMKNSEKAVEVSAQLKEAEAAAAEADLKSQQKSWYEERLEKRLEKLDARAEGGSDAAASKAVKLREWMAKREAMYGQKASAASEAGQTGAEQDTQDKKPDKSKHSGKTKEGESTVDELRDRQARDEEARRQEEDRRKRQEAQEESERKAHK